MLMPIREYDRELNRKRLTSQVSAHGIRERPHCRSLQKIEDYHDVMDGGSEPEVGNSTPESDKLLLPLPAEP